MSNRFERFVVRRCIAVSLLSVLALARTCLAEPQAEPLTDHQTEEVMVTRAQGHPPLWRISKDDRVFWLLGTHRPLPRNLAWDRQKVVDALEQSQLLLSGLAFDEGVGFMKTVRLMSKWGNVQQNAKGVTLKDLLSAEDYQKYLRLKTEYAPKDSRIDKLRPVFAADRLRQRAVDASGGFDLNEFLVDLAKKKRIKHRPVTVKGRDSEQLATRIEEQIARYRSATPEMELACFRSRLDFLEVDLRMIHAAALAWASGDTEALGANELRDGTDCAPFRQPARDDSHQSTRIQQEWVDGVESALAANKTVFGTYPITWILRPKGPLDSFESAGYVVERHL